MQPPDLTLDVRSLPLIERHPRIFALFGSLNNGQALVLISDHEPRPLRAEFDRKHPSHFKWRQRQLGDGRWEVRIVRRDGCAPNSAVEAAVLRSAVFAEVDRPTLEDLAHFARRAAIKRHHCVAEQGVLWPYAGIVENGIVQARLTTKPGREQAMYDVLPGEIFAETALFDRGHVALRYIALTADTVVVLLPVDRLRTLINSSHVVRSRIEEAAAQHTRAVLERFSAQISLSATARVAAALLPYAAPVLGLADALAPLHTMTQVELAASAGTVKEVVSRALAELEAMEAIRRVCGRIVKLDRENLTKAIEHVQ